MKCHFCGNAEPGTKVVDSRELDEIVRRRRECLQCGQRFTTFERPERLGLSVLKKDGRREDFSREKLARGIRLACFKRPVSVDRLDNLVNQVETDMFAVGRAEISSQVVGERVMQALRDIDDVAYVRYASVYRAFHDVEVLADEIEVLRQWRRRSEESRDQLRLRFEEEQTCWN